ncbi:hypothetical protein ES703_41395 [subsurface metagenome]
MTVLSGFPRFGKRWPKERSNDVDKDTKVIQTGMKGYRPSSTKHEKHGRIIFCNLDRRPHEWCHLCNDFDACICRPRNFKRRSPDDNYLRGLYDSLSGDNPK